jgi:hypothetical protein
MTSTTARGKRQRRRPGLPAAAGGVSAATSDMGNTLSVDRRGGDDDHQAAANVEHRHGAQDRDDGGHLGADVDGHGDERTTTSSATPLATTSALLSGG